MGTRGQVKQIVVATLSVQQIDTEGDDPSVEILLPFQYIKFHASGPCLVGAAIFLQKRTIPNQNIRY